MNKHKAGLTLGALLGFVHLVWGIMVAFGFAQTYLNWIFGLHFLNNPFEVGVFSLTTAATLVVVTFVVGYIVGWLFAYFWGMVKKG